MRRLTFQSRPSDSTWVRALHQILHLRYPSRGECFASHLQGGVLERGLPHYVLHQWDVSGRHAKDAVPKAEQELKALGPAGHLATDAQRRALAPGCNRDGMEGANHGRVQLRVEISKRGVRPVGGQQILS